MNAHFFSTKRAHYAVLRILRKPLKSFGLTAARYDLMHVLFGDGASNSPGSTLRQSEIRRNLGVCKSVVSRMLQSLEKLGLVRRDRVEADKRLRFVKLTKRGLDCMRQAIQCLKRASRRLLCIAIGFGNRRDWRACFDRLYDFELHLRGMRWHFCDKAALLYPWYPDD